MLLVDAQTVGGYPVVAVTARADLPLVGQLRPGDAVRFEVVSADAARRAWREQRADLAQAAELLRVDASWDRLAPEARG